MKYKKFNKDVMKVSIGETDVALDWNYPMHVKRFFYWEVKNAKVFGIGRFYCSQDYSTKGNALRAFKSIAKKNGWKWELV